MKREKKERKLVEIKAAGKFNQSLLLDFNEELLHINRT